MTRYFYDTEFLEDGKTIELISIGIVCEDGREYYAVNVEAPWRRVTEHEWLTANVVPHLPRAYQDLPDCLTGRWGIDFGHPDFKSRDLISAEIEAFLTGDVELWADYCAYDHVVLAQMWGPMVGLPDNIPMHTNDIQTFAAMNGVSRVVLGNAVITGVNAHHALADARDVKRQFEYIQNVGPILKRDLR